MKTINQHLNDIAEIRSIMERSSKFLSMSGLSGVSAGLVGLVGATIVYLYMRQLGVNIFTSRYVANDEPRLLTFLILTGFLVLITALALAIYFSTRMAKKKGLPIWTDTTKYLLTNLFIPLLAGGFFCLVLLLHGLLFLIPPLLLIFYGLALLNASKFTLKEIRYLGLAEIVVGLLASLWLEYGLFFWAAGFGVLHIFYGLLMYNKYET